MFFYTEDEFVNTIKEFDFLEFEENESLYGLYAYYHINRQGKLVNSAGKEKWGGCMRWELNEEELFEYIMDTLSDTGKASVKQESFLREKVYPDYSYRFRLRMEKRIMGTNNVINFNPNANNMAVDTERMSCVKDFYNMLVSIIYNDQYADGEYSLERLRDSEITDVVIVFKCYSLEIPKKTTKKFGELLNKCDMFSSDLDKDYGLVFKFHFKDVYKFI